MRKAIRQGRKRKREALVHGHLEYVSRALLEQHPDIVRRFIGRNKGIYALYHKTRLYYVGLATQLSGRLKSHLRNRHGEAWDRFSIYLIVNDYHINELEALLLRVAHPKGNKQTGKPAGSRDMSKAIRQAIREKQLQQEADLFERWKRSGKTATLAKRATPEGDLQRLLPNGARLRATHKGIVYRARARRDGTVRYNGHVFSSLSVAAMAILKRRANGWWFWQVERSRGHWVRLKEVRRAGTPLYA